MNQHQQSSGNLVADKRADFAHHYALQKKYSIAADIMAQALDMTPNWAAGWFRLGEYYEKINAKKSALESYRQTLRFSAHDYLGAGLKIAYLECVTSDIAPLAYTEALFDDYAERFDCALLDRLQYKVPKLLAALLRSCCNDRQFNLALDLGCGTGLMAAELRAQIRHLTGVDLSAVMLTKAKGKQLYDALIKSDLVDALKQKSDINLVMAADVFMYIPNLEPVFTAVAQALVPNGLFLFSIEKHDGNEPWALLESMRHAHTKNYVEALLRQSGFVTLKHSSATIRMDAGHAVAGLLYCVQRLKSA
jgi:predicted TPR repeat methyltransferase